MKKELVHQLHKSFEDCADDNQGVECWLAREQQELLGYTQWRIFEQVIAKAQVACQTSRAPTGCYPVDRSRFPRGWVASNSPVAPY